MRKSKFQKELEEREKEEKRLFELKEFNRQSNETQFPQLLEAIEKLRPVLDTFRHHHFEGVPATRKMTIQTHLTNDRRPDSEREVAQIRLQGKWLQQQGFHPDRQVRVIALNGLLIICPEQFSEQEESHAAIESKLVFEKLAG